MKILVVGVFYTEWSTHHPMVKALQKQNHQVIKFDYRYLALKFQKLKHPLYLRGFKKYYDKLLKSFPKIDYSQLSKYETDDNTEGSKSYACVGNICELT